MTASELTAAMESFQIPERMTPEELGDHLARLVWESFSDFIADGDAEALLGDLGLTAEDGIPGGVPAEEILIFLMWAHTRGIQLAFVGRSQEDPVRKGLDVFHAAIFEDMVDNGTPRSQLPIFEQHVSARYAEYYAAADESDVHLGQAVARHLTGGKGDSTELALVLQERALQVTNPLKDFLEEVQLIH